MAKINLSPIKSSQIAAVGYDAGSKTLGVQFKTGGLYHYHDISAEIHAKLLAAESPGKFLNAHVKGHKFSKPDDK